MENDLKILCIIPARGGSKGVPKKNIKLLANKPLIAYTIQTALSSKMINNIVVSTDSKEILNVAKEYGVNTPFLRPKEFSKDSSLDIEYINHTLNMLEKDGYTPDLIVLLRPTTPLRDSLLIDEAIHKIINSKDATGLRSAHSVAESPFKWFKVKNSFYTPICKELTLEDTNRPRQDFEDVYLPNGYVDIIIPKYKDKNLYGENILSFITPISYEIDTIKDFEYIEFLAKKGNING